MNRSSIYGAALIVGSMGALVTMIFHPTGHDLLAQADQVARRNEMITVVTHSLALAGIPILLFGFLGFSRQLGWDSPPASAAFITYAFGAFAAMCAAVINGLVGPIITRQILTADESTQQLLHAVLMSNGLLNQAFTKVFIVASSFALIIWSVCILNGSRFAQSIGIVGCVVGLISLVALFSGHLRLNVHVFGLLIFGQSVWTILVGILLIRSGDSGAT
jgi:hypothetical protein